MQLLFGKYIKKNIKEKQRLKKPSLYLNVMAEKKMIPPRSRSAGLHLIAGNDSDALVL